MAEIPPHMLDKIVRGIERGLYPPLPPDTVRLVQIGPGGDYTRAILGDTQTGKITVTNWRCFSKRRPKR